MVEGKAFHEICRKGGGGMGRTVLGRHKLGQRGTISGSKRQLRWARVPSVNPRQRQSLQNTGQEIDSTRSKSSKY